MADNNIIPLIEMNDEETGKICELRGGRRFRARLQNLGMCPGKDIEKICGQFLGGPVTIRVGNTEIAIGRGMARNILVEVER